MQADLSRLGVNVSVRKFTAEEGTEGHCELNNLRRLHRWVFDWLDRVFRGDLGDAHITE